MYSASAVDKEIEFCFLQNQDTKLLPRKKQPHDVLFLSSQFPAQSASLYPTRLGLVSNEYQIPKLEVPFTKRMTLLTEERWEGSDWYLAQTPTLKDISGLLAVK